MASSTPLHRDGCLSVTPLRHASTESVLLRAPGSKSHSTRSLILQHLGGGETEIEGCSLSSDAAVLESALRDLGASKPLLHAADGGAPGRFLLAAAAACHADCVIDGNERLRQRPFGPLIESLRSLGGTIQCPDREGFLPVSVQGGLSGSNASVDCSVSSQFASALMLIGPVLPNGLMLTATNPVSDGYLDLTVDVLQAFGASVAEESAGCYREFHVAHGLHAPATYRVPQDVSGAAFLWLAGVLGPCPVGVAVDRSGTHPDLAFLDCLEAMGANVESRDGIVTVGGDLTRGGVFDLSRFPDSACALGVAAAVNPESVTIEGAAHLRHKESNRIETMVEGLRVLGLDARIRDDGFEVHGARPIQPDAVVSAHDDHRVAMAFATLGTRHAVSISGALCVGKSFPEFFDVLAAVAKVDWEGDGR